MQNLSQVRKAYQALAAEALGLLARNPRIFVGQLRAESAADGQNSLPLNPQQSSSTFPWGAAP